jgi:hypothetical protein
VLTTTTHTDPDPPCWHLTELAINTLASVTRRAGVPIQLPFRDSTKLRSYWLTSGGYGSWQARRDLLDELMEPARAKLVQIEARPLDARLLAESLADLKHTSAIIEHLDRIRRVHGNHVPRLAPGVQEPSERTLSR